LLDQSVVAREPWLVCPSCRYDLNGLANDRCPECGSEFTRAGLLSLADRRRRAWLDVPHRIIAFLGSFAAAFSCWVSTWRTRSDVATKEFFLTLSAITFAIAWLACMANARDIRRHPARSGLWLIFPLVATIRLYGHVTLIAPTIVLFALCTAFLPAAILVGATGSCRRLLKTASMMFSAALALYGLWMFLVNFSAHIQGAHWSLMNPPFVTGYGPHRFMTCREGILAGLALLASSATLPLIASRSLRQPSERVNTRT
jgi:hypothetical protein